MAVLAMGALLLAANDAPPPPAASNDADLTIAFSGLRSAKGIIRACLTRVPAFFPNCDKDPASLRLSVAAAPDVRLRFPAVPQGDYALSILHDENSNGRLDTMLGIPREGVGFSENPRLRFSAPSFASARFHMGERDILKTVQVKYFL